MSTPIEVSDSVCVVCFKGIEIYSVGECDHPVCFECSTRMRVLCLQTECPICRQDLSKVIFSSVKEPFKKLNAQPFKNNFFERKYKICFVSELVKDAYHKLLEHSCQKCGTSAEPFKNFVALKDHLRREHDLFFCDLCIQNLKIFTNERKSYNRQQLALHRRKGDIDDTSHKGHPLCKFCDQRYMDNDELFRHLRKDHLYCHLCDADGLHHFYGSYDELRDHFRKDHYLCEEDECSEQTLTGVFRTDIDLKAHKASEHGRGLSKQASRQARTLELQFTLTPRLTRAQPQPHHSRVEPEPVYEIPHEELAASGPCIDTGSTEQFPTLAGCGSAAPLGGGGGGGPARPIRNSASALQRTQQNFPSLAREDGPPASFRVSIPHQPGPSGAVIRTNAKPNVSIQVHNRPQSSGNRFSLTETSNKQLAMKLADKQQQMETSRKFMDEFPSLSKKDRNILLENNYTSYQPPANTIAKKISAPPVSQPAPIPLAAVRAPPPPTLEAFPALHSSEAPAQPQWITPRPKEPPATKPSKAAPAPDFPSLKSKAKKKNDKPTTPIHTEDSNNNSSNNNNKKKAKSKERSPDSVPSDFVIKNKINDKENAKNGTEVNKKKINVSGDSKDKKNANLKNGPLPDKMKNSNEIKNKPENKKSLKASSIPDLEKDFPSLNIVTPPASGVAAKVNESKPPPGFSKPPPGFNGHPPAFHRAIPPCNGFTFTSSSGQNYNIPTHNYVQPIDFNERNKSLVAKFLEVLDSPESFEEFKQLSQMFREGSFSSKSYYDHCIKALGDDFESVFPELLALLPDIRRQRELYAQLGARYRMALFECPTCGQVLPEEDTVGHHSYHSMQATFPALGATSLRY